MNADIFNALELLEKEGIPQSYMIEKIEQIGRASCRERV